ncbi:MAG: preprotein translocase subunit SecE [Patescibacteria group bacterium]|nr:preprotein translocase subunit SecE [Patescibacteria group bacterium]
MANKIVTYVQECREELKKVTWPSREQVIRDTLIVLGLSIATAAFFGLIDFGMMSAFRQYLQV